MSPSHNTWSRGFLMPPSWNDEGLAGLGIESQQITQRIGAGLMTAGTMLMKVHPLAGAITIAVGALTELIGSLFKPDITKIETTRIVDRIEAEVLKPLRAEWNALSPQDKTPTAQEAALLIFDNAWAAVVQGCANPQFGNAGVNCVNDRQQGSCHWTVDGQTPGVPPNCGNWFIWYRDVIANDPAVVANAAAANDAGSTAGTTSTGGGGTNGGGAASTSGNAYLFGGLVLLAVAGLFAFGGGD